MVKLKFSGRPKHIGAILALNLQVTGDVLRLLLSSSMVPSVIPFSLKGPGDLKV
jgi:hypothetical protein